MLKITGIIIIFLISVLIGWKKTYSLNTNVKINETILLMIKYIETEIRYRSLRIDNIISNIKANEQYNNLNFINDCEQYLRKNYSFPIAWGKSIKNNSDNLSKKNVDLLMSFGKYLGTSDIEGQIQNCELHEELFSNELIKAREEKEKKSKMYTTLGVLCGIGFALFFY